MKKVLIVTYSFPPFNNIASRRFGDMVEYFEDFGWDPYILTTNSIGDLPINIAKTKIYKVGKVRSSLNTKVKADVSNDKLSLLRRKLKLTFRLVDSTYFNFYNEFKRSGYINDFKAIKFDVILASFGPGSSLFLGKFLSKELNVPLVADFRDLGALHIDEPNSRNCFAIYIDKIIEKKLLQGCAGITTVSNGLMEEIKKNYNINKTAVIYNGFKSEIEKDDLSITEKYFYYAGRFYPNQLNSVYLLLDYIAINKQHNLFIRSLGPMNLEKKILDYADNLGILKNIMLLDPADSLTIKRESSKALANLVVESLDDKISWKKGVLTGKLMGLLCMNPPILAIARKDSEIGEILNYTNKGMCLNNIEGIDNFVKKISENTGIYSSHNSKIGEFSKKSQTKKLCRFLDSII